MRRALLLLCLSGSALATPAQPGPPSVSPALARQVEGCWDLADDYRIWLTRGAHGLTARQETHRGGRRITTTQPVHLNPADGSLVFEGIGRIHHTIVVLRWTTTLQRAFLSDIGGQRWIGGIYGPATRCPAKP